MIPECPVDTKTKLEILSKERDKLRDEMLSKQTSIRSMIIVFLTVAGAMTGAAISNSIFSSEGNRSVFFLVLSQLQVIVLSIILSYWASQRTHSGYIAAVERRINHLANENLSLWECYVGRKYFLSGRSMVLRGTVLVVAMALFVLGGLLTLGITKSYHLAIAALVATEAMILLAATIAASREGKRIEGLVLDAWDDDVVGLSKK